MSHNSQKHARLTRVAIANDGKSHLLRGARGRGSSGRCSNVQAGHVLVNVSTVGARAEYVLEATGKSAGGIDGRAYDTIPATCGGNTIGDLGLLVLMLATVVAARSIISILFAQC
jgi:hypothetical protein